MTTTYEQGDTLNTLNALEVMEWGMKEKNQIIIRFIRHILADEEDFTVHVGIMATKTIVTLMDFDGSAIKKLVLRHWLSGYAGVQIVGGSAYAIIGDELINL